MGLIIVLMILAEIAQEPREAAIGVGAVVGFLGASLIAGYLALNLPERVREWI